MLKALSFPDISNIPPPAAVKTILPPADTNANREEYYKRVCDFLLSMVGGEWIELSSLIGYPVMKVADKQPHFIEAVKRFMDEGRPWYHFGDMYFNSDYTRIYKCEVDIKLRVRS